MWFMQKEAQTTTSGYLAFNEPALEIVPLFKAPQKCSDFTFNFFNLIAFEKIANA